MTYGEIFVDTLTSSSGSVDLTTITSGQLQRSGTTLSPINAGDDLDLGTGDLSATKGTFSTGVLFGSDTASADTLDDYEEGIWTPAYDTNTTSSSAISYNNQTGASYIKIGRVVHICGRIRTLGSQTLDGTGDITVTGLPFPISSGFDSSSDTQDCSAVISVQQVDGWEESPLVLLGQEGFSSLDLYNGGTLNEPVVKADFRTTSNGINRMRFSGFYFTDS